MDGYNGEIMGIYAYYIYIIIGYFDRYIPSILLWIKWGYDGVSHATFQFPNVTYQIGNQPQNHEVKPSCLPISEVL
jgi:hypothetical protein